MPIKVYQSKRNKKLYEVYVSIKSKGERLQTRRRKDFQGNFISSLPTAKKVEFELKRKLIAQKVRSAYMEVEELAGGMFKEDAVLFKVFHSK